MTPPDHARDDQGPPVTEQLCNWAHGLRPEDVPPEVLQRAKHLILDGIACGLVGAHVPWSEHASAAIASYEPPGTCRVIGYNETFGPLAAAVLNGAFIQATELDDYHSTAPLHSASVILPSLLAASDVERPRRTVSGLDFLLAAVVGFETGPRIGNALHGASMLSVGWHSGAIFGAPAAAAAASKLFALGTRETESALGIACTQASGLMAAQYEGMVKRVQHSFAARNGLFGALLAHSGYEGMRKILERPYGGFLATFSQGFHDRERQYMPEEAVDRLGELWHTAIIRIKLHACVAGCHGQIECLEKLQAAHPERFATEKLDEIESISVGLSDPVFPHCGWVAEQRPLDSTGAQMNAAYIGAVQLVDRQVLLAQFAASKLDRDDVWDLVHKTTCYHAPEFDVPHHACGARIRIAFRDGVVVEDVVAMPKGFDPPIQDRDIVEKWRKLAATVIDGERLKQIEECVLNLESLPDVGVLASLLGQVAGPALQ